MLRLGLGFLLSSVDLGGQGSSLWAEGVGVSAHTWVETSLGTSQLHKGPLSITVPSSSHT